MKKRQDRNPTMHDVAKVARVGRMTISRVLNNSPSVRPSTRKRVLSAIAELGYQQNEAARMLRGQRAMMVGLIVPDLSDSFFASCAQTVQEVAHKYGYMTLVAASARDSEMEIKQAQMMAGRRLSGILLATSTEGGDIRLLQLQKAGLPIVAFDRPIEGIKTDCVVVEDRQGGEEATQHLIKHGHRNIACVGYDGSTYTSIERIDGYLKAMRTRGYKPNITLGLDTFDHVAKWVAKTYRAKERPTAIFSLNHVTAIRLLRSLVDVGLAIPKDVALVGFGDFELSSLISPPLTVVAQSPVALAKQAMTLLMDRIKHNRLGTEFEPVKVVLPVTLTVRASCGCKPLSEEA